MKSLPIVALLVLALACLYAPSTASAYGLSAIGARIGSVDPDGAGSALEIGGHLEFEQSGSRLHMQPGVMYWSSDNVSDVNPNFDLMYHFASAGRVSPYVGGGAGLHFYNVDTPFGSSGNTDLGANMFGGVLVPMSDVRLFGEARFVASDRSQFGITGGVTMPFGNH